MLRRCLFRLRLAIITEIMTEIYLYKRVVLKFGTTLLTSGTDHLDIDFMSTLVAQVAELRRQGVEVVIVTSGAVAAGRQKMGLSREQAKELKGIPLKQVLASIGQGRLMKIYEDLFEKHGLTVAQALLTKSALMERAGYLNARNTLLALMDLGVIGIINENDVVAVEELEARFGDNDNLSAMVANLTDADLLLLLTDIGGLFTADPHLDPQARLIAEVKEITPEIAGVAACSTSKAATGGMITKIEAARAATACGVTVVIASGREPDVILNLARGEAAGTRFLPIAGKRESRARWLLSGLGTRGRLVIDEGAAHALRQQNGSLLAAGIQSAAGDFKRGDIVDIFSSLGRKLGSGITNYAAGDVEVIKGARSTNIGGMLGHDFGAEVIHRNNLVLLKENPASPS
jgi:glutamate 5-kinase